MRNEWGNIDISEYLARLPDRGRCLTNDGYQETTYVHAEGNAYTMYDDYVRPESPHVTGFGPVECSTCTDLALVPEIVWDTNYYYRKLGFSFPYMPTKKELRLAFQERDGANNAWLMMAFKTLVNDKMRLIYDLTPLGQYFLDAEKQEALKKEAIREAVRRRQESGQDTVAEEVLEEWGLGVEPEQESRYGEDSSTPEDTPLSDPPSRVYPWRWSYYLWRSSEWDTQRLGLWQQLLVSAFAARKMRRTFSVGYFGKQPHRCLTAQVDGRQVLFLHEDQWPDEELANHMVMQVLLDDTRTKIGVRRDYPQLSSRWEAG